MDYVNLGMTGLKVSRICLGCMTYGDPNQRDWFLGEEAARPFFQRALEAGINFFDTADVYSLGVSEEITGRALKDFAQRDEVVIATKVHGQMGDTPNQRGLSRKHILHAIDDSLRRLGTDYVDLYQIHRFDRDTPIEETLEALHDVVKAGKARYIGASSMYAWEFAQMLYTADLNGWTRFVSMQNHYNLDLPRGRARDDPALRGSRHRRHPVESAGARLLGGQPHPRQGRRDDPLARATASPTACTTPTTTSRRSIRSRRWRAITASARRRSRWRGCCTSPPSPRRSSARARCSTSTKRLPRSTST